MSNARRFMHIRLDAAQTERLLCWAGTITTAETGADCEPGGYVLHISVGLLGHTAEAASGGAMIDLGDVDIELIHEDVSR